jgi:hypothetical protein
VEKWMIRVFLKFDTTGEFLLGTIRQQYQILMYPRDGSTLTLV